MPLVASTDPASGDGRDYNRTPRDGKHRSHRFIASNQLVPGLLKLPGWQKQVRLTEEWLQGRREVPEIAAKWAKGAIVTMALDLGSARAGADTIPLRVVMTSNKVGHDYPTGPLDIIQSWVELHITDEQGQEVFTSGTRDGRHFLAPGTVLFKAEPVDQNGNLIDRHNLWEMVGVRFRRSLFPGYSDTFEYNVRCASPAVRQAALDQAANTDREHQGDHRDFVVPATTPGRYRVEAVLNYRKVDQFLLNYLLGEKPGQTAPVVHLARKAAWLDVTPGTGGAAPSARLVDISETSGND